MDKFPILPFSLNYITDEFVLTHDLTPIYKDLKVKKINLVPFDKKKLGHASSGLLGVIDKYGIIKNEKHLIIKASPNHLSEMANIEFLSNQIFDLFSINMATYGIGSLGKKKLFFSENFMDDYTDPATPKHLTSFFPENEGYNVRNVIKLIEEKIIKSEDAIHEFIRLTILDSFIGNYDRHPGNLMFIYINGEYQLSPAYDNISMLALRYQDELADLNFGGRISTAKSVRPMLKEYLEEFLELKYYSLLKSECEMYFAREKCVYLLIKKSQLSKRTKNELNKLVKENIKELRGCYEKIKSLV